MSRRLAIALGVLAAVLVATQLALPPLAERYLRGQLERVGDVDSIEVGAFPALKLLWRRADRVEIAMAEATAGPRRLADLLATTRGTGRLRAGVATLRIGPLVVRDASLVKQAGTLIGRASVTAGDLRSALPPGVDVRPVASEGGQLTFQVTASVLGRTVRLRAVALASEGRVVVAPVAPLADALTLTVFSDPRVLVEHVGARPRPGGFTLTARARLRP